MKSSHLSTSSLNWNSNIQDLYSRGPTKSAQSLIDAGYSTLWQLLWIIPLRTQATPVIKNFQNAYEECLFSGVGKVLSTKSLPSFKGRGKNQAPLLNITAIVKDIFSDNIIELKWFNAYPSQSQSIQKLDYLKFSGKVQIYNSSKQIVNPDFESILSTELPTKEEEENPLPNLKIQYPTINGVNSSNIKKVIDKIPAQLWREIEDIIPEDIREQRKLLPLDQSFLLIHAKTEHLEKWSDGLYEEAKKRLIYEEFLDEQLKIHLRKKKNINISAIKLEIKDVDRKKYSSIYPYELTPDQDSTLKEICIDLNSGKRMMRLVQGDVGCGKTTVAITSSFLIINSGLQVALMCPTEALAKQHFEEIQSYCHDLKFTSKLLCGSTSSKDKKEILKGLENGEVDFIIGTHALIQNEVKFKNLALAIIDEQHKFGVDQRLKLLNKGEGTHCLIMSATPIPRSLSMTQYGDLNISTIKTIPSGRKGSKTRIVMPENFGKFLNFINTRASMGEQIYIVVPAITESPKQDMLNLEEVLEKFKKFFPNLNVQGLHGQLKNEDKNQVLKEFKNNEVNILIATSVIEVGINILNATVMAIMNPERFGLSSLHQLRGRVGRGDKPGFCFLVIDKSVSQESIHRVQVIEKYSDGFQIAEEDLKIRGAGDTFGKEQSGSNNGKKIANIILDFSTLQAVRDDLSEILKQNTSHFKRKLESLAKDAKVFSTI
ncbi:putative ATP-dependent DNA helicase [Halobacteriovorax marinus SJ]|uniref:ATP-dependent DNA helicase n=1 Tax=Halobacteriovorax marinus (strain ATCC BAA-682 / DSM 15412 / SJ) TaxID=862908 RepID=E1X2Q2_HALMS|nr:ATP-dependent DNA helicase RecG [Halobacteriovorax marinus]CBW25097.1 putative ATP-dependent DNA helicase [Halobacteriovorax marinus SJ]